MGATPIAAHAAAYNTPQPPAAMRPPPAVAPAQPSNTFAAQSTPAPDPTGRLGTGPTPLHAPKVQIQSGNDFNWLQGGGG
ncbi:MAG TPA: hypothetical protein VE690_23150 [Rhodopila sp.]|nr:hypothetical protein [Rhodopila sp.]